MTTSESDAWTLGGTVIEGLSSARPSTSAVRQPATNGPLEGIRVLDLTNVLSGPLCVYQLGQLGAEVIKVEVPRTGDLARQLGADENLNARLMGASFLAQNGGKRSITTNLKHREGRAVLQRLVRTADVLVENFRPAVMRRWGLGYEELAEHNRGIVYCAISGFGQDGPLKDAPAYDQIIQGLSGAMSITGDNRSAPMRAGYPVADTFGGINAAFAISAALVRRAKTGQGAFIDVSLLDCMIVSMGWVVSNYLISGVIPRPMGNENFTAAPSGTFATGSGLINIAANKQEQFEALARVLEREDLICDERFSGRQARKRNRVALTAEIEQALQHRSGAEWEPILNELGIPAGRVLSVPEALDLAQVKHRALFQTLHDVPERDRSITVTRVGFKIAGVDPQVASRPPRLGEHTEEILKGIGYDDSEIEHLRNVGAV